VRRAAQRQGELTGNRAAIEAQLTDLHHSKPALEMEPVVIIELIKAWARARAVATAINDEEAPRPTFARAIQNMAVVAACLDTLPAPSLMGCIRSSAS
jgi:hypothetical protein